MNNANNVNNATNFTPHVIAVIAGGVLLLSMIYPDSVAFLYPPLLMCMCLLVFVYVPVRYAKGSTEFMVNRLKRMIKKNNAAVANALNTTVNSL